MLETIFFSSDSNKSPNQHVASTHTRPNSLASRTTPPSKTSTYGMFDKILNKVCFTDDVFTIKPQYPLPQAAGVPTIDFVVTYVVEVNDLPIFFLEIKLPLHLDHICSRVDADVQMRARFRALYNVAPTPRLHGVSVMGQRLAFYCMDEATGRADPNYVAPSTDYMIDIVPAERWDTDITTEDGYQKFMAVTNDVKEMAAAL